MAGFKHGDVVLVNRIPEKDHEYLDTINMRRQAHDKKIGTISDHSDAHGRCYGVRFQSGDIAWYEPEELSLFKPELKPKDIGIMIPFSVRSEY